MRIEKIEYLHFVIIAVTTFCVFGLTLFVRFDMEPYQNNESGTSMCWSFHLLGWTLSET